MSLLIEAINRFSEVVKLEKSSKIDNIKENGEKIGNTSWQLGNEFVLGNRYRRLQFTPTVVPYKKVDLSSQAAKEKIVDKIFDIINMDSYFSNLLKSKDATINFINNLFGMKVAEGSSANYNIGNIQVGYGKLGLPNKYWSKVFLMGDKNYTEGGIIPYIELWRSYDTLENGVADWIYFLKDMGMLKGAIGNSASFYNKLRTSGYFGSHLSKSENKDHRKSYVGGIDAGRKRNSSMVENKVNAFFGKNERTN